MTRETLALNGGPKTIQTLFARYNPIGEEEATAVQAVMKAGVLSQYIGRWHEDFRGGPKVREFEDAWAKHFGVKHAVSVNSLTSGLIAAVGALDIEPGDEVIVSPWTMSATATAILHWNAIPVFADIDPETFSLDPASVEANITPYTKAIIVADIFGHPAESAALMKIAERKGLKVITDAAQAPGATDGGLFAGTLTHIGGYSLNYHKHIHTGEGGVMVTNDDRLADRMRLIRNHAEVVVDDMGVTDLSNMVGHNFRLGEIECAIGVEQLKKLTRLVAGRQRAAERLADGLRGLDGLRLPAVRSGCTHVYYLFGMVIDQQVTGVSRSEIVAALRAEGVAGLAEGYQCIHLIPMYQRKIAYGSKGFPWSAPFAQREVSYARGICPVAEKLHDSTLMSFAICVNDLPDSDVDLLIAAFQKVWRNMGQLRPGARARTKAAGAVST